MKFGQPRRLVDFAVPAPSKNGYLMAILKAYGDESGKSNDPQIDCIAMATVIGTSEQWSDFNERWDLMLKTHDIPYLHMKDIVATKDAKDPLSSKLADPVALDLLMQDASYCIIRAGLQCFANAVWLNDLRNVSDAFGLEIKDPYSFTLYVNVVMLGTWTLNHFSSDPSFQLILDRIERGYRKADLAHQLYQTDSYMAWRGWPLVTPMSPNEKAGSREMNELQAADLVAWSLRRNLKLMEEWLRTMKETVPEPDRHRSLQTWLEAHINDKERTAPHVRAYFRPWACLMDHGVLKFYNFDEDRLKRLFFLRQSEYPPQQKQDAIAKAGRPFPLAT